ncbi:hypothetical protein ACA910_021876 [Epithemia clementina (nom. ined.)]
MIRFSILAVLVFDVQGWIASTQSAARSRALHGRKYSFFKDLLNQAFENDDNLLRDEKRTGQIDEGYDNSIARNLKLTATQEMWRKKISQQGVQLSGKAFDLDLYLTGTPNKDPSNDLFGAKVNISSRDRKVGQTIPEKPTISNMRVVFQNDNKCKCETENSFMDNSVDGDWKLAEDGTQVRFRLQVTGFTRTVETRGTIQSVYWSNEPDKQIQTSTVYSIPKGWLYGEAVVTSNRPGSVILKEGILKVEQSMGLLGAGTRMSPCGVFEARMMPIMSDGK